MYVTDDIDTHTHTHYKQTKKWHTGPWTQSQMILDRSGEPFVIMLYENLFDNRS